MLTVEAKVKEAAAEQGRELLSGSPGSVMDRKGSPALMDEESGNLGEDLREDTDARISRRRSQKASLLHQGSFHSEIPLALLTPPSKYEGQSYAGWVRAVYKRLEDCDAAHQLVENDVHRSLCAVPTPTRTPATSSTHPRAHPEQLEAAVAKVGWRRSLCNVPLATTRTRAVPSQWMSSGLRCRTCPSASRR
jgi:hypothetical protein